MKNLFKEERKILVNKIKIKRKKIKKIRCINNEMENKEIVEDLIKLNLVF